MRMSLTGVSLVRGTPSGNAFLADLSANPRRGTLAPQRSRDECRILTKESPIDPDKTLSRVAAGAGARGGRSGAALRRAFERGGARSREGQAVELSARLQGRDRSRSGDRPL